MWNIEIKLSKLDSQLNKIIYIKQKAIPYKL